MSPALSAMSKPTLEDHHDTTRSESTTPPHPLDLLLDVSMHVSVVLGSTHLLIRDILRLHAGSVIQLDTFVGHPLELLINHQLVARGDIVVVNDKLGIRLTDVVSPVERLRHRPSM